MTNVIKLLVEEMHKKFIKKMHTKFKGEWNEWIVKLHGNFSSSFSKNDFRIFLWNFIFFYFEKIKSSIFFLLFEIKKITFHFFILRSIFYIREKFLVASLNDLFDIFLWWNSNLTTRFLFIYMNVILKIERTISLFFVIVIAKAYYRKLNFFLMLFN